MPTTTQSEPNKLETRGLLAGAATAFVAGLGGAIWYTKRKQAKETASVSTNNTVTTNPSPSVQQQSTVASQLEPAATVTQQQRPPSMTPEEYAVSKRQARFFAFKALGYGTLLALSGAGVLSLAVGWWLDVRNVSIFTRSI